MKRLLVSLAGLVALAAASRAFAEGGATVPPIQNAAVLKECGACHMAYPPQMLPQRSWRKLMGDLSHHFGENASLAPATRSEVESYLLAHAGDAANSQGSRFVRGIPASVTPLRITDTRFWIRGHSEIPAAEFATTQVKSKANCAACHRNAPAGQFGEEE